MYASVILLNERWNITLWSVFTLWHLRNFLPRIWGGTWSFSLLLSGSHQAGCGEGQAAAGVAQLPSFSKEIRTFGWQGSCFHICSFRILCSCSTPCDPAYPFPCPKSCPGGLAGAGAGAGGSWEPAPCLLVGCATNRMQGCSSSLVWRWAWDKQQLFRSLHRRDSGSGS